LYEDLVVLITIAVVVIRDFFLCPSSSLLSPFTFIIYKLINNLLFIAGVSFAITPNEAKRKVSFAF